MTKKKKIILMITIILIILTPMVIAIKNWYGYINGTAGKDIYYKGYLE